MKRIIRIAGFALALLLLFLGAAVVTTSWLKSQNDRLLADTLRTKSAEFTHLLALANPPPPPFSDDFVRGLGRAIGGHVTIHETQPAVAPGSAPRAADWRFSHAITNSSGQTVAYVQVQLPPSPTVHAVVLFQRAAALLLLLALLLLVALIFLVVIGRSWGQPDSADTTASPRAQPSDFGVLSHLAERSARQSVELEKEREERQRAEADTHLKQILLNRALQEKIDMGRDLHDGLIQSLYATGLTIQAGRKALDQDPATARSQIDTALQTLNAAIREVRTYIAGLGPEQLHQRSFADSVRAVVEHHCAVRALATDIRIDEDAASQLPAGHVTDLLQIVREAVSNSLRHGHARQLSIRLHRSGEELCLLIHDDGRGFDARLITRGHGLDNMQARADRLGAKLDCQSTADRGTRLVLTFSVPPVPSRP